MEIWQKWKHRRIDVEGHALVDVVRRAHAVLLFVFTGLSAVPFDLLATTPPPELTAVAAERAAVTRFSLDLLDATSPGAST